MLPGDNHQLLLPGADHCCLVLTTGSLCSCLVLTTAASRCCLVLVLALTTSQPASLCPLLVQELVQDLVQEVVLALTTCDVTTLQRTARLVLQVEEASLPLEMPDNLQALVQEVEAQGIPRAQEVQLQVQG
jgi:hypothetical protein